MSNNEVSVKQSRLLYVLKSLCACVWVWVCVGGWSGCRVCMYTTDCDCELLVILLLHGLDEYALPPQCAL